MRLYNTLTGEEEEFVPSGDKVKIYVCGITPYAPCHLGHAMSYVIFDVLRRYLEHLGYEVDHVQNFTDVDDKIIQRAQQEGIYPGELTERYIEEFMASMEALNVRKARVYPRATQEIPHIIEVISTLVAKGYAYPSGGGRVFPSDASGRVRQAEPSYPGWDESRGPGRGRYSEGAPHGLRPLEGGGRERGAFVGESLGPRQTWMAHRVHRHVPDIPR